ncbi:uncharacterized protein LOC111639137 isoform X2 [Centruroides sculpturatus]|uniref:uncharacterized protein LOC111639137 isoform X2 n=1 Tax=Centruroides sculpturatus TaxID=218467 RepID=UPI000C6DB82B|nr:uncharacterized protein LOC111639137 isoform X2 [Centruroides sculpturatus]
MEEESPSEFEECSGDDYSGSSDSDEYLDCERQCPVCSEWRTDFQEPICYRRGNYCDNCTYGNYCDNKNQKRYCNYCRLNRCYKVGMKVIDVYGYIDGYTNALRVRLNEECQGRKLDNGVRWKKARDQFYDLRDNFHNWICCFRDFQIMRRCDQVSLREKYKYRGLIMEIVQQSLEAHMVLRFENFFWNPLKYHSSLIIDLISGILKLTLKLRLCYYDGANINKMKLKLILRDDDFNVELSQLENNNLTELKYMLNDIEEKFTEAIKN